MATWYELIIYYSTMLTEVTVAILTVVFVQPHNSRSREIPKSYEVVRLEL
jgi:hypothetical protein